MTNIQIEQNLPKLGPVFRTSTKASPFIKWVGGKQALLPQLLPHFPKKFDRYVEPFIGGGAVFFSLEHKLATISDQNEWLVDSYIAIRDDWRGVADVLDTLPNTKEHFLRIRSICHASVDLFTRAAYFIYLNKTCFRGLFRVNQKGGFNVPYGAYDRRYYDSNNLEAASLALKDTTILTGDFEQALLGITDQDFVYFDPPYFKLGGYSDFNRYTSSQFREADQVRLASLCNELTNRGVRWALSNSDTQFIKDLYKYYRMIPISARREINLKSQERDVAELLILNY
jgi:DNA adenine methylase